MDQETYQLHCFHGLLVLARLLDNYISKTLEQDSVKDDTMMQNDLKWTQTEIKETISRVSPLGSHLTPNNSSTMKKQEIFAQVSAYFGEVLDNVIVIFKETTDLSILPALETLKESLCTEDKSCDGKEDLSVLIRNAIDQLQRQR